MKQVVQNLILLLVVCFITSLLFYFIYKTDNKYLSPVSLNSNGQAVILDEILVKDKPLFLAEGWKLYPDKLLLSEQISTDMEYIPTTIGEFASFAPFHENGSPYGEATYVLDIKYDGNSKNFNILIPEVFSACSVYANGELIGSSGKLSPYKPQVKDLLCTFTMKEDTRIIVNTVNYTHYYSGMTYPPAIGTAGAIAEMSLLRMMFYGALCFSSLAVSLFSAAVWAGRGKSHNRLFLLFGILALSFSVRISYPFTQLIGVPLIRPLYALEDACAMLGIWCALSIILYLTDLLNENWAKAAAKSAIGFIAISIVIPLIILPVAPAFTAVYGLIISWYKILMATIMISLTLHAAFKGIIHARWLLAGTVIYGIGLLVSVLSINEFEPAYMGWPDEYGSYGMVVCFAILMIFNSREMVLQNIRLSENLQEEVRQKTKEITGLINERQKILSEFLHDFKTPMSSLMAYTQLIRQNDILLDEDVITKLEMIENKCRDMSSRIKTLQDFTVENTLSYNMKNIDLLELLKSFHFYNRPDIEAYGPNFIFRSNLSNNNCHIYGDSEKINRMLQNLAYNAAGFTSLDGTITLTISKTREWALIDVSDTGCGISEDDIPKLFDRFYTTRGEEGGKGLGLYIVKTIVKEHSGNIDVKSIKGVGTTFIIKLPLIHIY